MLHLLAMTDLFLAIAQSSGGGGAAAGGAAAGTGALVLLLLLTCCGSIFALAMLAFYIWMIIDCATRSFPGENDKLVWILIIVLVGPIGAAVYFFVGRSKGTRP